MRQTAVEWLVEKIQQANPTFKFDALIREAKAMETKEKLKHQLFIGKVTEILGFDKTVELLKECNNEIL